MKGIVLLDSVESTNSLALSLGRKGAPSWTVLISREQRKGRGRMGRGWFSPRGKGLYMSLLLRPEIGEEDLPKIPLLAAISVATSLRDLGIEAYIRWPNDITVKGKKIGGILVEVEDGVVVIGFGVNTGLRASEFPPELINMATSILEETGNAPNPFLLGKHIIDRFERFYRDLLEDRIYGWSRILSQAREMMDLLGHKVEIRTSHGMIQGVAESLGPLGELVVVGEGERRFLISSVEELRTDISPSLPYHKIMAVAVGNSVTKIGVFSKSGLEERYMFRSGEAEHEIMRIVIDPGTKVVIGSVVPLLTEKLIAVLMGRGFEPYVMTGQKCKEAGIEIVYKDPDKMGIDRIASSIAASSYYGSPAIVVDFGTAISITAISDRKIFGGPIMPGPALWFEALSSGTALLPLIHVSKERGRDPIGEDTIECMRSGLFFGIIGAVTESVRRMRERLGRGARVVATGGYSDLFASEIGEIDIVDPDLGLKGLAILFDMIEVGR